MSTNPQDKPMDQSVPPDFQPSHCNWQVQPQTANWVRQQLKRILKADPFVAHLERRLLSETGTRLVDWVDQIGVSVSDQALTELGFAVENGIYRHASGIFPAVVPRQDSQLAIAIKVDCVADFLFAHRLHVPILGPVGARYRSAQISSTATTECLVVERHGADRFDPTNMDDCQISASRGHAEQFLLRRRQFDDDQQGFDLAEQLIRQSIADLGVDWTCSLFFSAERRYWQSRNRAAEVQKLRQDRLGLGWANHDHHTYRSSRHCFWRLVEILELLGFRCRERFYGGREAGWGAQVLEQSAAGIVVFADLDLTTEEVTTDFAHDRLAPDEQLGTVGLWCKLHGEAFLGAGMHHLECQFDFAAARRQLAAAGIETMTPFTDFSYLKQAFTAGQRWTVADARIDAAVADGSITTAQAKQFRDHGSIGSHLEILQRDDGYKGFNQTGISEIIRQTDPRRG